ncbi:DciA family protein [Desulfurispira natronophila]|uniref:DUF721 domain-containing protein n=1 Tax=Desulfurispira natronophila TaxID=682562 RepID=A0A7W7Y3S1_9BACT|nr:DciA family protein [Desulfurispira natronophila]MBB5021566.1 hypothetical protein [Desulfurispira natronophila]
MNSPKRVNTVLQSLLHQYQLDEELGQYQVAARWEEIVGESMARCTRVTRVQADRIHVVTNEHRFLFPLSLLKPKILRSIKELGLGTYHDITFSYSNRHTFPEAPPPPPKQRELLPEEEQWCHEQAARLDGDLAEIFSRLVARDLRSR